MSVLDWVISVGAVVVMFAQGWWFSRSQKTTEEYFVGGRSMNWLAVGLSMFATTFSPLSFVGLPREAAYVNYHLFLAILFIPLFAAPIVGWLFVPIYHRLRLTSAYEYLELRFDRRVRRFGSLLYGMYVLSWMGSMLYATSLIVQVALDLTDKQRVVTMVVLGVVTTIYTTIGGFKATVWSNVIKSAVLAGVIVTILVLAITRVEGGLVRVWEVGREHDKFSMFNMTFDLTQRANFFSACAFGMFVYLATAVAGQTAVQRYVSMPSVAAARRSLAVNGIGTAVVCFLFFLLGSTMFAYFTQHPSGPRRYIFPELESEDQITIYFVQTVLPYYGLLGLLLGALFTTVMGSVSSGLNSMSALVVSDWFGGQNLGVRQSRRLSALFGVATVATALVVPYLGQHVFDIIIRLSGAFFGPLLGVFALGVIFKRTNAQGAMLGLLAGVAALVVIFPTKLTPWWYGGFTCIPTVAVGILASSFFPPPSEKQIKGLVAYH